MTDRLEVLMAPQTPQALLPRKAHATDAGFDLAVPVDCLVPQHGHAMIDLEFALQIPPGWYGHVFGRSSVFRNGLLVHPGIIDADYRGTIRLLVYNRLSQAQTVRRGERVAQLLILPVPGVTLKTVQPEALSHTTRGTGGIGSTGR